MPKLQINRTMKLIVNHIICVFGFIPELNQAWSSFFNNFLGKSPPNALGGVRLTAIVPDAFIPFAKSPAVCLLRYFIK